LTDKFSIFSFSKNSTWRTFGLVIHRLYVVGFIVPFIPPRYGWGNWTPATTGDEYQYRLTNFWVIVPIMIIAVFAYVNIRNKIDLILGTKRTANFKVTEVLSSTLLNQKQGYFTIMVYPNLDEKKLRSTPRATWIASLAGVKTARHAASSI
jgi:hypothetical protein